MKVRIKWMKQQQYKIPKSYFRESQYAVNLSNEFESDAEGLIFDHFIHEIGMQLHIDVLFERATKDGDTWFLGRDRHVQILLKDDNSEHYVLTLSPLDELGESRINTLHLENLMNL
jgi:hypothetical protein